MTTDGFFSSPVGAEKTNSLARSFLTKSDSSSLLSGTVLCNPLDASDVCKKTETIAKRTIRLSAMTARTEPSGSPKAWVLSDRSTKEKVTEIKAREANKAMMPATARSSKRVSASAIYLVKIIGPAINTMYVIRNATKQ